MSKRKRRSCKKSSKIPIRLRQQALSDGRKSLYLDTYWEGERSYEFLNLYLTPEKRGSPVLSNINTLSKAEQIRAQRLYALSEEKGTNSPRCVKESFMTYYLECMNARMEDKSNYDNWDKAHKHLMIYTQGNDVTFEEIDFKFLLGFKTYLLKAYHLRSGAHRLKQTSAHTYMNKIKSALTLAFEEGKILVDLGKKIYIKPGESVREVLSWNEVTRLLEAECESFELKRAFFFCVLTGLRFSDMVSLTWSEIRGNSAEGWYLKFNVKKNGRPEHLPITEEAMVILGEPQALSKKVFQGLIYSTWVTTALTRWMANDEIWRRITFHCARHTHATLLLNRGVDIYIVSKLLGHKHVHTTQIYTKVVVATRQEALKHIPSLDVRKLEPVSETTNQFKSDIADDQIPSGKANYRRVISKRS